jgi:L-histidine Nalpha-methyltransferase
MSMFTLTRQLPEGAASVALREDVRTGLTSNPKWLPPKWFYDARGSELFEEITRLPEYYPARAERAILRRESGTIAAATGARTLVELGSGSSEKTRLLIGALRAVGTLADYVPVDVSDSALQQAGRALPTDYPGLTVHALVADFTTRLDLPPTEGPRLIAFLGSTIGNLLPAERAAFLSGLRTALHPGDALLLGTDLVKDEQVLLAAYNDAGGVTADFNKNVLAVVRRELGSDLDPDDFDHVVLWNREQEWIEMRLRARTALTGTIPAVGGLTVRFAEGEELRTEVSAKFREPGLRSELARAGLKLMHWWTDPEGGFALSLSEPGG